ncbi:hypothetical protein LR48_Vigan661s001000 [Vigna angularis]|uniref:Uncharacterized protein n=1 Tax=Phaseolus angularis TaxID=3914 RepID=A0A0L9TFJ8_PHAAN|nr:hypothetical protein LR48_Vigan661s001000 [Vigna angularis]
MTFVLRKPSVFYCSFRTSVRVRSRGSFVHKLSNRSSSPSRDRSSIGLRERSSSPSRDRSSSAFRTFVLAITVRPFGLGPFDLKDVRSIVLICSAFRSRRRSAFHCSRTFSPSVSQISARS